MKGWTIFLHSLRLVLRNFDDALRVSALLYGLPALGQIWAVTRGGPADAGLAAVFGLASVVTGLWIAVAWHRYVLNEEYPAGWIPPWFGTRVLAYFWRMIVVGLSVAAVVMLALVPVGLAAGLSPALGGLMVSGLVGLGAYVFFRLGVMLPAAAVGEPMGVASAWAATRDRDGAVVVLAFIVLGGSAAVQALNFALGGPGSLPVLLLSLVVGWFTTMVGVSILTTLYGHYVQGRPVG